MLKQILFVLTNIIYVGICYNITIKLFLIRRMEYCICQKDRADNKKVVKIIHSKNDFLKEVEKIVDKKYDARILKNISRDAIIINDYFTNGYYLLVIDDKIELVHKHNQVDSLFVWKLLSYENKDNSYNEPPIKKLLSYEDESSSCDNILSEENTRRSDPMKYDKLQICEFKLDRLCQNPQILIIAKRGSGKTVLVQHILYKLGIFSKLMKNTTIISPTKDYSNKYEGADIHFQLTEDILNRVISKQKKNIELPGVIVMDNCLACSMPSYNNIMMNGRHYNLTTITTISDPLGLSPSMRINFDYIFMLKESSTINKKKLWENYASMFPNFECFDKAFSKLTENYSCMVINNRSQSDNLDDQVYWFKAKI